MGKEIEIKVPLTENQYNDIFANIFEKKRINKITVKDSSKEIVTKIDEYYSKYKTREERINNHEPQVIRIRTEKQNEKNTSFFTIKRKSIQNGIEFNQEDETYIENASVLRDMFELANYICWFKKQKDAYGAHCSFEDFPGIDFHLELEKVNNLLYVEVEVVSDDVNGNEIENALEPDKIKSALCDFVRQLNLNPENKDKRSWVEIITGQNAK